MPRPIHVSINLNALRHNHGVARRLAGDARIWSVLKADAYGHGVLRAVRTLEQVADGFALLDFADAAAVREAGFGHPILMLEGFFRSQDVPLLVEHRLTPVLHNMEQVEMLTRAALPAPLPIYVKVNSGMNRLGFDPAALPAALAKLEAADQISGITLMTHFAEADGEAGITEALGRFRAATRDYAFPVSIANSAALVRFPEARTGWVRPGIMLYGSSPMPEGMSASELGLLPVMTLRSEIISVRDLARGERVGYGGLFEALEPMRVAIVACGYADGYPRHAPTGTPVLVDGIATRLLGRISMDMLCVDVTRIPSARVGTAVTLWGEGLPADDVARAAGTISYELFCALARRVPVSVIEE